MSLHPAAAFGLAICVAGCESADSANPAGPSGPDANEVVSTHDGGSVSTQGDGSIPAEASASGSDAALVDDAPIADTGSDSNVTPAGLVPVFLAMGYGTRRVVSCDYGLTWPLDEFDVPNGNDDGYLVRGLAWGGGRFVAAVGGGGVQKIFTSDDAVTWNRMTRTGNGFSDVAYGKGRFVAGGGHVSLISLDGLAWEQPGTMGQGGILRHLAFGDYSGGWFVAVGDNGRRMDSADGVTWGHQVEEGEGLSGVAFGAGVFVAISGTTTRLTEDGGAQWISGTIPGASEQRGILFDGQRFIVTTSSGSFTSSNGKTWMSQGGNAGPEALAVSPDRRHYAGASGGDLFHSTDGIQWTRVKQGGQGITRVKFGWVKPSTTCPAR